MISLPPLPVKCDIAVIHAPLADRLGNARLGGNLAVDQELVMSADTVIITAEEIVDRLDAPIQVAGLSVTALVHAPRGAWPTSCYPLYPLDGKEILRYMDMVGEGRFEDYLASLKRNT